MKLLTLILSALIGTSAWAMPKVGDYAKHVITFTYKNGSSTKSLEEKRILSQDDQGVFTLESKVTNYNGDVTTTKSQIKDGDFFTTEQLEHYLKKCEKIGGNKRRIEVPAGKMDTCRYDEISGGVNGHVWLSTVPFGVVRDEFTYYHTGLSIVRELSAYGFGN